MPCVEDKDVPKRRPQMRFYGLMLLWIGVVGILVSGCNRTYQVKVDGIRDNRESFPVGTSYALLMPPKGMAEEGFDHEKAKAMVKTSLATQGYYPVERMEDAELVITVEYGTTPGRVSFRQKTTMMSPPMGHTGLHTRSHRFPGLIPQSQDEIVPEMVKTKYVTFSARDPDKIDETGKPQEVWNLTVKVEDEGEKLEEYLPVLLAASINYIGENTGNQITIRMQDDSEAVQYVINDATFESS